ncbi:MAG: lipoyl(octanoyl) transferase LipB [Luteitalea sp.]|nr:lipoyl(octanoyl) transferase LipB [Luteitalea sp.]
MSPLDIQRLGVITYEEGVSLQAQLAADRRAGIAPDTLLLLQHQHVITLGVKARNSRAHIIASDRELAARGVAVYDAGRGGDVTYHGPGQLVGYPVIDLKPDRQDVHRYVRDLEEVLIRTAADFGVRAGRLAGLTGVWVAQRKLAAIGVRISRWVTSHGFALNVSTNLDYFDLIVPCGIADHGVTSLELLAGPLPMAEIEDSCVRHFCDVFDRFEVRTSSLEPRPSPLPSPLGINKAPPVFS